MSAPHTLSELNWQALAEAGPDAAMDAFLSWAAESGFELYPAQEEAILEIFVEGDARHVVLNTPTGSGKSLVALAMHFRSLVGFLGGTSTGRTFYTCPIKALVSEKFFDLCRIFGAENVGMMTGDGIVNAKAPVVCCTAEILANMALREHAHLAADSVVMDEFHYYADPSRGWAWQVPLLTLPGTRFLLMSATLGDVSHITDSLTLQSNRRVALVTSKDRPVPLDFTYVETPLQRTIEELLASDKGPIYLVNFTQKEAADEAQNLVSLNVTTKEEKKAITAELRGFRFDSPYGKDMRRFVTQGIGVHHAGLLPKYRRLVERLAQKGLSKVVSGTDTLGVGVNIPLRTVLFTKLYKYDGQGQGILSARDFQQIAGRAGRKGFDTRGSVVCQAPAHVIENKQLEDKAAGDPKKLRKLRRKKPPPGFVHYTAETFQRLAKGDPETLVSRFRVDHGLLLNMLDHSPTHGRRDGGVRRLVALIARSHESPRAQKEHRRHAAGLFRALRAAGVVEVSRPAGSNRPHVSRKQDLQLTFSLFQTLSLYLVETLFQLDKGLETYPLDVLSLVEAICENPRVVLLRQEDKLKKAKLDEMKEAGVEYEERMAELERISYPKPNADFIYDTFNAFREHHPWVRESNVKPKGVAAEMLDTYASFGEFVQEYGLQRSEGVLLRYLSEVYKVLTQNVPDSYKTDGLHEAIAFFRTALDHADSSLLSEWESLLAGGGPGDSGAGDDVAPKKLDKKAAHARVRAELHQLVKLLAARDYEAAAQSVWQPSEDDDRRPWTPEKLELTLAPFFEEHAQLVTDHRARFPTRTRIVARDGFAFKADHQLLDPEEMSTWFISVEVDFDSVDVDGGVGLLRLVHIGG